MRVKITFAILLLCLGGLSVLAQEVRDVDDSMSLAFPSSLYRNHHPVQPPKDLRDWTPSKGMQFQLYINFTGVPGDTTPRIDILKENLSWPYLAEKLGDTVYFFIAPPGYSVTLQSRVDSLETEFPIVIWAGTERAIFWFSYESGKVVLDTTVQPASFISTLPLRSLDTNILVLQLSGKNRNAKIIRDLLKELGDQATLTQLDDGFYHNVWFRVSKTVVQNWKTNETKDGTLLALKCKEGARDSVALILKKYQNPKGSNYAAH